MTHSAFKAILAASAKPWTLAVVAVLYLAEPVSAANNFLSPMGSIADAGLTHLIRITLITMVAIVPVLIGVPLILWRYRRGNKRAAYRPEWYSSKPLEVAMWGVPVAIIGVLGFWLWHETIKFDPYRPLGADPLQVQVVGLDWKWLFIYPEQKMASVGELVIPVGRPVTLHLTTDTVMQSLMIPALAGQIYAMPGMETKLNFRADRAGSAVGRNMQYNGEGFANQAFTLRAMPTTDWSDWVSRAQQTPLALDTSTYNRLAQRGSLDQARAMLAPDQRDGPLVFTLEQPDLFEQVIQRYHDGTAVTAQHQPGAPTASTGGRRD